MNRREMLGLSVAALGLSAAAFGEDMDKNGMLSTDPKEIFPIWPGLPPGGKGLKLKDTVVERSTDTAAFHDRYVDSVMRPSLTVFRPEKPNGAAVLVAPGGGYVRIVLDKEGFETARFLNQAGVTVFILRYRLPGEGWAGREDVPLQDAQRAIRLIRARAKEFAIDPDKIGIMGFSAGGHVAASLVTRFAAQVYKPVDAADALDARPAYGCLMYPVITMGPGTHEGSRDCLLGPHPAPEKIAAYSCENLVSDKTPPCFLAMAADDGAVPPFANGIAMFNALQKSKIASELHVFEKGGHGFGLRLAKGNPCMAWPDLFVAWAASHGFASGRNA